MKEFNNLIEEIKKTQIIIMAGGSAKRFGFSLQDMPKAMLKLNEKPLIDWCIEHYSSCGFEDFILIVKHHHEKIEEHIKNNKKRYGENVRINFIIDPEENMGKGKSLVAALNKIDTNRRAIISYPDDIFIDSTIPISLILHHISGVRRLNIIATILFVSGTKYPFGVGEIDEFGVVRNFIEKPIINKFSSTGTIVVEPEFYKILKECIDMNAPYPIEFESVVLPKIASMGKLYSMVVSSDIWIPINTIKEYELAEKIFKEKKEGFY
ncbi:MAG: sugar phosphate nucleotidyltransferase [Candidatus Aenigmatarchaeota archaeon]